MISSVLELFGCEQQKTMLRGVGERQESRRFSSGRDTVLFTIATEKRRGRSAGEGAVQLQGSKQGENTRHSQRAGMGRSEPYSTEEGPASHPGVTIAP